MMYLKFFIDMLIYNVFNSSHIIKNKINGGYYVI